MLENILQTAIKKISLVENIKNLEQIKVELLGKKSELQNAMNKIGSISVDERREFGKKINLIKDEILNAIQAKSDILEAKELTDKINTEAIDLSIPGRINRQGSVHPISQVIEELVQLLSKFNFHIKEGPSIENDWYNFSALNIDENHPARQMFDTFYLNDKFLLRTHTSPVQIRSMENMQVPLRIIAPGRTYRSDSDMTHTPMFHQIEGLVIDRDINIGHLKYVIINLIEEFFEGRKIDIRFRPSYFPFTSPSAEVDISIDGSKWLEVLGCGMVHPNVLQNANVDHEKYTGFAFGLGCERFAMLKYNIKDLRQFFEGDIRWLKHYNFSSFDIPNFAYGLTK